MKKWMALLLTLVLLMPLAVPVQAAETIYELAITLPAPVAGQTPEFFLETVKDHNGRDGVAHSVSIEWYQYNPGKTMGQQDVFQADKIYEVTIRLVANGDMVFAKNTNSEIYMTATINGKTANVSSVYGNSNQVEVSVRFDPLPGGGKELSKAAVTGIDAPAAGQTPDYTATTGSSDYKLMSKNNSTFKNGITWYDGTDGKYVSTSHKFIAGHVYSVEVHLVPAGNMLFSDSTTGSVNGVDIGEVSGGGSEIAMVYEFPACTQGSELLMSASVTGIDKPFQGKTPDYTGTVGSSKYKFKSENSSTFKNGITWYDNTAQRYIKTTEKFQPDHDYTVEIHLVPTGNLLFSDDATGSVNGVNTGVVAGGGAEIAIVYNIGLCPYHTCKLKEIKQVEPTCTTDGKKAYYHCDECDQDFEDTMATRDIENIETWGILKAGHSWDTQWSFMDQQGHAHSCLNDGCKEHDQLQDHEMQDGLCAVCGYKAGEAVTEPTEETVQPTEDAPEKEPEKKPAPKNPNDDDGADHTLLIIVIVAAVVIVGGCVAVTLIVLKKNRKSA